MSWIVGILSVFLVIACLLLMLLVLIQLPKKEAGMGQAFGGGATDALFGAGSGTALTKMTKYTTGFFFVLTLLLWVLKQQEFKHSQSNLEKTVQQIKTEQSGAPGAATAAKPAPAPSPNAMLAGASNSLISTGALPLVSAAVTNAGSSTNPASKPTNNATLPEEPAKPK